MASIVSDAGNFDLLPTSQAAIGVLLLYRADASAGQHCENEGDLIDPTKGQAPGPDPTPSLCVIDLVVFTTLRARQIDRAIDDRIRLNIRISNQILRNGRINSGRTFRLVEVVKVDWLESQGAMASDLDRWARRTDALTIRHGLNADLGVFIAGATAGNGTQNYPGSFGRAQDILNPSINKPWAAIVKTGEALAARMTFPHELAHLMDCWHDYEIVGLYNNAFTFRNSTSSPSGLVGTVVASGQLDPRIPFFSNPNVTIQYGTSTVVPGGPYNAPGGSSFIGNNNRRIAETFCLAADQVQIRPLYCEDCAFAIAIEPDRMSCPCAPATLSLNTEDNQPPLSVLWESSPDGVTYTTVGTVARLVYTRPCRSSSPLFFRVTATFANGRQSQAFYSDMADTPPNASYISQGQCAGARKGAAQEQSFALRMDGSQVRCLTADLETPVQMQAYSVLGQQLASYIGPANGAVLELKGYQGQPVFIRCVQGSQSSSLRVVK